METEATTTPEPERSAYFTPEVCRNRGRKDENYRFYCYSLRFISRFLTLLSIPNIMPDDSKYIVLKLCIDLYQSLDLVIHWSSVVWRNMFLYNYIKFNYITLLRDEERMETISTKMAL